MFLRSTACPGTDAQVDSISPDTISSPNFIAILAVYRLLQELLLVHIPVNVHLARSDTLRSFENESTAT
jgi:hypothetical protein